MNPPTGAAEAAEAAAAAEPLITTASNNISQEPDRHPPCGTRGPMPLDSIRETGSDPFRPSISCSPQRRRLRRQLPRPHRLEETQLETASETSPDDCSYTHSDDSSDSSVISVGGFRQEEALDLKITLKQSN